MISKKVLETMDFICNAYKSKNQAVAAIKTGYILCGIDMDPQVICAGLLKETVLLKILDGEYISYTYSPYTYSLVSDYTYYKTQLKIDSARAFDFLKNASNIFLNILAASEIAELSLIEDELLKEGSNYWADRSIDKVSLSEYYLALDPFIKSACENELYDIFKSLRFSIFDAFDGTDKFEGNIFDYYDWSAPVFRNPVSLKNQFDSFNLKGLRINDIWTIGLNYEEKLNLDKNIFAMILDEPIIFELENSASEKSSLEIDFSDGGIVRLGKDSIKRGIFSGIHGQIDNCTAKNIFSGCIGDEIVDVCVGSTEERPFFTGSYGMLLPRQKLYINDISISLKSSNTLTIQSQQDYMYVKLSGVC